MPEHEGAYAAARTALEQADALLVAAGAGMGVDSGLPDFRGNEGFWRAYPPFAKLGLAFSELANPRWFEDDPALAWGFYGHRLGQYRETVPHAGFERLRALGAKLRHGAFVFTSNVDGHFQKAGLERVCEAHGSIHHLQCARGCQRGEAIWECWDEVTVDPDSMRAAEPWPRCPGCGGVARPNILMFGDSGWRPERSDAQSEGLIQWLQALTGRLVIVEIGAGTAVPTVRSFSERLMSQRGATLVRVNLREPDGPPGTIALPARAREALERMISAAP